MKMLEEAENQPQKRIKCEEDRISALPDCLLHEILSRLPHTKHAIRTGILSKRWACLWTCVPTLIFSHKDLPPRTQLNSRSDFALMVDKTISQCRQVKLKKFKVHTFYDIRFESQFNNWLRCAISCNVEELTLKFCYNGRREAEFQFVLDQFLFSNSNFTDLTLKGCKLNPTGAISWKNLRRLRITYLNLDEDLIMNILSGSPQLETLELEDKHITSESKSEAEIKINALSLTQCPQLNLKKFQVFTRFRSEFESHFNSWIRYAIRCGVRELDLSLSNLYEDEFMNTDQILFTSSCITDLILCGCMVNPVGAISWKNLKTLSISETSYGSIDEDLIENILSGSPVLETLELDNCYAYRRINITTSKSVKNLVFSDYLDSHDHSESEANNIFEINAPNILSLTIRGHVFPGKLLLLNVSSLVNVDLRYYFTKTMCCSTEAEEEMLKGYILNLGHVKELKIWFSCYEAVSRLQAKGFIFPSNVKLHGAGFEKTKKLNSYLGI